MRGRKRLSALPTEILEAPRRQRRGQQGNKSSRGKPQSFARSLLAECIVAVHVVSERDARKLVRQPYIYTLHPTKGYRRKRLPARYS